MQAPLDLIWTIKPGSNVNGTRSVMGSETSKKSLIRDQLVSAESNYRYTLIPGFSQYLMLSLSLMLRRLCQSSVQGQNSSSEHFHNTHWLSLLSQETVTMRRAESMINEKSDCMI